MTTEQLRAAYPGAAEAVQRFEYADEGGSAYLARCRRECWSMDRIIEDGKAACRAAGVPYEHPMHCQLDHPDFRRYLAAKLGYV